MRRLPWLAAGLIAAAAAWSGDLEGLFPGGLDHPAIRYSATPANDPVARLNRQLQEGAVHLRFEPPQGWLRSVLQALDIPIESQMAVFSKTSLQKPLINPQNPRTIFFNDSVAAAWVRYEPFVELAAEDPRQGVIFYTLDQQPSEQARFVRRDSCLTCHESWSSLGVPGMLVRSVFPAANGAPIRRLGDFLTDHRSPWEERWGGWYVTGQPGALKHMGNATVVPPEEGADPQPPPPATVNLTSLEGRFDTGAYLSPYSDIVALMVFEHQMHLANLLTRVGWEIRLAQHEQRPTAALLRDTARELAAYLLFVDEAPLPGRIEGSSGFARKFAARGPRDSRGRSLRQLDLQSRLMRYPCSYMIYSEAFDGLPEAAREAVYARLWQILSGQEKDPRYARLPLAVRQAIVEILRETRPGLPDYFRPVMR